MKIVVINPNTTAAMTAGIGRAALAVAAPGTEVVAVNPADGPASIEFWYDEAFAVPGLLAGIAARPDDDGYVVACFDDPGLDAARTATARPSRPHAGRRHRRASVRASGRRGRGRGSRRPGVRPRSSGSTPCPTPTGRSGPGRCSRP